MPTNADKHKWKAITLNWIDLLDYDHVDKIGVCLTQREVAIIKAMIMPAYWSTRWEDLTISPDQLDAFMSKIDNQLSGNDCGICNMEFRDNPLDLCEVQYSVDDGLNWLTMFRKDNCPRPGAVAGDVTKIYIDIDIVTTNNTTYAGDIINICPDWEYVDADSDKALCWALDFYVDMISKASKQTIDDGNIDRQNDNDFIDTLADIIATGIIAGISATAGAITFPAIVIGAATWAISRGFNLLLDHLLTVDSSDFDDEDAKEIVQCMMYNSLKGSTPQFPAWETSLDYWESLSGPAKSIAGAVHIVNQEVDAYINMMLLLEDINSISDTLPACPCPTVWSHIWNFRTHGKEAWQLLDINPPFPTQGYWDAGNGFVARPDIEPGQNALSYVTLNEAVPRVTTMTITYDCTKGHWDHNRVAIILDLTDVKNQEWEQGVLFDGPGKTQTMIESVGDASLAYVYLRSSLDESSPYDLGEMILWKIEFEGEGTDPFYGRITS